MTDRYAEPIDNPWSLGESGQRMARWFFGMGFFTAHLGLYLAAGLGLLLVDILGNPGDLWSSGPLLRWGYIVVAHFLAALVSWAVITVVDAARAAEDEEIDETFWPTPVTVVAPDAQPGPSIPAVPRIDAETLAAAHYPDAAPIPPALSPPPEPAAPIPAPAEAPIFAGAPPRGRFSPPPAPPAEDLVVEQPGWLARVRRKPATPAPDDTPTSDPSRPSIPNDRAAAAGWRVISGDAPARDQGRAISGDEPLFVPPPASPPPTAETARPGDSDWTWIEAAAQAWLAHRAEATRGPRPAGAPPPAPESDPLPASEPRRQDEDAS
jgi:hypothetical protein